MIRSGREARSVDRLLDAAFVVLLFAGVALLACALLDAAAYDRFLSSMLWHRY
jgi:hypothetical protein